MMKGTEMDNLINLDQSNANIWEKYLANYINKNLSETFQKLNERIDELQSKLTELSNVQQQATAGAAELKADIAQLKDASKEHSAADFVEAELKADIAELKGQLAVLSVEKEQLSINVRNNNAILQSIQLSDRVAEARDETRWSMLNKVTNSQAGEDSIVAYIVAVLGIPFEKCNYIDLGANQPREMSNTYFFYSMGARGVLVDANDKLCEELKRVRGGDIVLNNAVSDRSGESVSFNIMNIDGLSTAGDISELQMENPDLKLDRVLSIETISYNDIVDKYLDSAPVILNLDIEGKEMDILNSIDFENKRPLILIVEMIPYSTKLVVGQKNDEIMEFMKSVDYSEFAFTGINSIFIDNKALNSLNR